MLFLTVFRKWNLETGLNFVFIPNPNLTQSIKTTITIYGNETGGSQTIPVEVIVKTPFILALPFTSKLFSGVLVFIPTLPAVVYILPIVLLFPIATRLPIIFTLLDVIFVRVAVGENKFEMVEKHHHWNGNNLDNRIDILFHSDYWFELPYWNCSHIIRLPHWIFWYPTGSNVFR